MNLQQLIVLGLQASILMTVFGFGLQSSLHEILHLVRRPSLFARSLAAMFLVMPVLAVALVRAFDLHPPVEIALVVLSISPMPPLLPRREIEAGGRTPYALGLLTIAGILSIAVVPLGAEILGRYFGRPFAMPPGAIAQLVLKTVLLPLAAGMALRASLPAVADRIDAPVALVAKVLLAIGVLAIAIAVLPRALALVGNGTLLALAAFVVAGLAVGHGLGRPHIDDRIVLALSTASRHPAIALAVARVNFPGEPQVGAAIVLYLVVATLVGVPYVARQRRRLTIGEGK
jgi:BASS family bile acid:Na+ symporter